MASKFPRDRWTLILIAIIIVMGVEIVYLVSQNQKLKAVVEDPKKYFSVLSQDEVVPSFTAQDINGDDISVRYSSDAPYTLLFWFSVGCSVCEENFEFWNRLYGEFNGEKVRFLGMCPARPDEIREFVAEHSLEFPVMCAGDPFIMERYKGNVLPQTVVITPEGKILDAWPGIVGEEQEGKVLALLQQLQP